MSPAAPLSGFDPARRAGALSWRLVGALCRGAQRLMLSVGHRNGLLEVMRGLPPATSQESAERTALTER